MGELGRVEVVSVRVDVDVDRLQTGELDGRWHDDAGVAGHKDPRAGRQTEGAEAGIQPDAPLGKRKHRPRPKKASNWRQTIVTRFLSRVAGRRLVFEDF